MITGKISELSTFVSPKVFDIIHEFLLDIYEKNLPDGTYLLDKGVYASVSTYDLKNRDDCSVEIHKHHIDIQSTLVGVEGISVFDADDIMECGVCDSERDVAYPSMNPNASFVCVTNKPGYFLLIHPNEPHRPMEYVADESRQVRKYVIKIDTDVYS